VIKTVKKVWKQKRTALFFYEKAIKLMLNRKFYYLTKLIRLTKLIGILFGHLQRF